jgi:hypothetical protein
MRYFPAFMECGGSTPPLLDLSSPRVPLVTPRRNYAPVCRRRTFSPASRLGR